LRMVTPVMAKVRPGDASGLRGVLRVASRLVGRGATRVGDGGMRLAEVVVIAVSTGGPAALEVMLPMLPVDFAVPLLIVQHMPKIYTEPLAERLGRLCRMPVRAARGGEPLRAGIVWLAPGDEHMEISAGRGARPNTIRLHRGPALNSCRPSADYLFRSAARVYGNGTLAVVMTGMGADGVEGSRAVREAGGTVLAQDKASSAVWGMPGRVVQGGIANAVVPLQGLAEALMRRVGRLSGAGAGALQRGEGMPGVRGGLL